MKIAIIGGGAAGMASAYLLHDKHRITVLEKQPILGGNIRTLNKNVKGVDLASELVADNGVIEFLKDHSPHFNALMADLGVELEYIPAVSTQLFFENGYYLQATRALKDSSTNLFERTRRYLKLLPLLRHQLALNRKVQDSNKHVYAGKSVADLLGEDTLSRWFKMLLMYSYSIPYAQINELPAELAFDIIHDVNNGVRWNRIVGGVYTYIEKILEKFSGEVRTGSNIVSIKREPDGVQIILDNEEIRAFDTVIFATPPDQVLQLLIDATDDEKRRFGAWEANTATTVIHTDKGIYEPYALKYYTEFDVFEKDKRRDAGYNAYLNRLCGINNHQSSYNLAYNMMDRIDPRKIIHRQEHHTPLYTAQAFKYRDEIIQTNGEHHTYHAGAYLGNGLHEGAIASAVAVSKLLDGRILP